MLFSVPNKKSRAEKEDEDEQMNDENEGEVLGLGELIKELKAHSKKVCLKDKVKDYILVGVVGQPNTGKSTIIRTLKKERV